MSGRSSGGRRGDGCAGSLRPRRRVEVSAATASATVGAAAHRRGNSAHRIRAHVVASGSARWTTSTWMPSASASSASLRWRTSGAHLRASATVHSTGGSGHSSPARSKACASTRESNDALWATSTRPSISPASSPQHVGGRRRRVHHLLGDAGQPLDPARQRPLDGHQRLEAVVQLAAAHQHRADLGQLAQVAAAAVGLGVDRQVLGVYEG